MTNYEQLSGHGAPSNKTVGNVGQMYVDLDTGKEYICAKIFTVTGYKIKRELYSWVARELDPDEYATLTWARFAAPYVFKTDEEVETTIDRIKDNMSNKDKWNESVLLKSVTAALPTSVLWSSVTYGDGKFVAVAYDSNIAAYSTDGITWTQATLPVSVGFQSVTYGDGKFVVVAQNSTEAVYSEDGISWTQTTLPVSAYWKSVTYGNGKFVAVTYNNTYAAYSTDGIAWNQATLPVATYWASVTHGNGKFVAVAGNGTYAAYSTDGINWRTTGYQLQNTSGEDVATDVKEVLGAATTAYVDSAIQTAIQNSWEASY